MPMVKYSTVFMLLATSALAQTRYVVECTAPCVAFDGTTQPAGTFLNRVIASPTFNPGPGFSILADTGQALYAPSVTMTPSLAFIARFTAAEQTALTTANPLWGLQIAAAGMITVTNTQLLAGLNAAVAAGVLTQARMDQVLNLSVSSP